VTNIGDFTQEVRLARCRKRNCIAEKGGSHLLNHAGDRDHLTAGNDQAAEIAAAV
jgi:hypothetical protein